MLQRKTSCVASLLMTGLLFLCCIVHRAEAAIIGDRLVVAVNSIPYTQRQLELYLTIKESLRQDNGGNPWLVSGRTWGEALVVFIEEMTILQEAMRLGSFAAPDQLLDKYNTVVRTKLAKNAAFKATLKRLGVDDLEISRTLDSVLRVASFRQNKDHQDAQTLASTKGSPHQQGASAHEGKWLTELHARSNTRVFAGAETYVEIQPTAGGSGAASP